MKYNGINFDSENIGFVAAQYNKRVQETWEPLLDYIYIIFLGELIKYTEEHDDFPVFSKQGYSVDFFTEGPGLHVCEEGNNE